jgi:CsoR family transcriptional regulator, copper-sensing transcriptional repressor
MGPRRRMQQASSALIEGEQPYLTLPAAKGLADRLARIEGHVRSVRRMVLEHRCADEILLQVAAVKAAMNQVASVLIDHELSACMTSCMQGDADERLHKVSKVLSTLLKQS